MEVVETQEVSEFETASLAKNDTDPLRTFAVAMKITAKTRG